MIRHWLGSTATLLGGVGLSAVLVLGACGLASRAAEAEEVVRDRASRGDLPLGDRMPAWTPEGLGNGGGGLAEEEDDLQSLLESLAEEEETTEEPTPGDAEEPSLEDLLEEPAAEPVAEEPAGTDLGGLGEPLLEEPEPVPEPEPEPRARRTLGARQPVRQAPAGAGAMDEGRIFEQLGLTREARQEEAKELVRQAEVMIQNNELVRAEGRLEKAVQLDPASTEAERLLSEVRILLGDTTGTVPAIAKSIREQVQVQREQAVTEIRRLINEGVQYRQDGDYSKAVERFERALEGIRNFPFNLDLDEELRKAEYQLAQARKEQEAYEEKERQRFLRMVRQTREAEATLDLKYVENQIRELRRKAEAAEQENDYERAIRLYERILQLQPRNEEIQARLARAKEQRHIHTMGEHLRKSIENYELAVLGIEESSVTYQQIFRYPEAREWLRISPKVISIEEEIAAAESPVEKEIRRKLEEPFEIGFEEGVPLKDALNALQTLSGVNFVLNREGLNAAESTVKLPRFPDLPLKNVLSLVLEAAGEDFGYAIKEGAVVIGPRDTLKTRKYLRFYEVTDLIQTHPDFEAPPVDLDELMSDSSGAGGLDTLDIGAETPSTAPLGPEKLLELIEKELGEGEGMGAEGISMMGGKLAARTTLENHLKLSQLLEQFRQSSGMMVTVESRFLDIQDNFLEDIGIDMGSANSTFLPNSIPDVDGSGTSLAPGWEYVDPSGDPNFRMASIGILSQPLGSKVNPFNISSQGGGAFQLNVLNAERYQLEALLTAVGKTQEIRRLNSPRVTAFNGQVAHTMVVNQAAYIQDLEVNQTGVIPVINPVIDVLNSGSILEVRPTISYDRKYVVLEIQPTLAEQLDSDIAVLNLSGNFTVVPVELPVLSVTKIKTTVTVPDGGTVLVGGLKREITNDMQIGVPGFLDIPLVNLLFGRKGLSKLRSNLFVLLNARITIVHEEEERLFGT